MKFSNFRNVVKVCEEFLDGEGWCIIILKKKAESFCYKIFTKHLQCSKVCGFL